MLNINNQYSCAVCKTIYTQNATLSAAYSDGFVSADLAIMYHDVTNDKHFNGKTLNVLS